MHTLLSTSTVVERETLLEGKGASGGDGGSQKPKAAHVQQQSYHGALLDEEGAPITLLHDTLTV